MKRILLNVLSIFCVASLASARERFENVNSIRALAMGGASIAVVNDETALMVNPAGLGKLRNFYGTILDPELDISSNYNSIYQASPFSQPFTLSDVGPALVKSPNTYYYARAQMMPSFVAKNFGIGILAKYQVGGLANTAGTTLDIFSRDDLQFLLGYNLRLFDGRIKIGFTGKIISRIEVDETALPVAGGLSSPALAAAGYMKEGVGVGADIGLTLAAPWTYIPTISAVLRDVGGTAYDQMHDMRMTGTTSRPNTSTQDLDVAVALFPIHSNHVRSAWTVEYKHLLTASTETDKAKLLHVGMEVNISDILFLRAGYHQRYFTGGMELASERMQFQLATYGEEIGTDTSPLEDRRMVMKIAWRF